MVADSVDVADVTADESVEAELGVVELWGVLDVCGFGRLLSMERRGLAGRGSGSGSASMGAAEAGTGASYAFVNVLRTVGETALRVSSRSEVELLPKVRSW
jgi:hypothetical protein